MSIFLAILIGISLGYDIRGSTAAVIWWRVSGAMVTIALALLTVAVWAMENGRQWP